MIETCNYCNKQIKETIVSSFDPRETDKDKVQYYDGLDYQSYSWHGHCLEKVEDKK